MLGILLSVNVSISLIFLTCCAHTMSGSLQAPKDQSLGVFTSVIVIVCVGALVVTIQAKVRMSWCCNTVLYSALFRSSSSVDACTFPNHTIRFSVLRDGVQLVLPGTVCPWLLRCPTGYCGPCLVLRPCHLHPCTHRDSCLGLVHMGCAVHSSSTLPHID